MYVSACVCVCGYKEGEGGGGGGGNVSVRECVRAFVCEKARAWNRRSKGGNRRKRAHSCNYTLSPLTFTFITLLLTPRSIDNYNINNNS